MSVGVNELTWTDMNWQSVNYLALPSPIDSRDRLEQSIESGIVLLFFKWMDDFSTQILILYFSTECEYYSHLWLGTPLPPPSLCVVMSSNSTPSPLHHCGLEFHLCDVWPQYCGATLSLTVLFLFAISPHSVRSPPHPPARSFLSFLCCFPPPPPSSNIAALLSLFSALYPRPSA